MRILTPLAILIAGVFISGSLLYGERFRVWQHQPATYLVHDTWTGALTSCSVEGKSPNATVNCSPVGRQEPPGNS
jgi:hypothetical protein